jgi:hypothetical protein
VRTASLGPRVGEVEGLTCPLRLDNHPLLVLRPQFIVEELSGPRGSLRLDVLVGPAEGGQYAVDHVETRTRFVRLSSWTFTASPRAPAFSASVL